MTTTTQPANRKRGLVAREGGLSARGGRARVGGSGSTSRDAGTILSPLSQLASLSTTPDIFARGLGLWRGGWVRDTLYPYVFHVVGESALYSVNLKTLSCDCEWWREQRNKTGKGLGAGRGTRAREGLAACKHIVAAGARAVELVEVQG